MNNIIQELLDANLADAKHRWAMYKRYLAMDYSKSDED